MLLLAAFDFLPEQDHYFFSPALKKSNGQTTDSSSYKFFYHLWAVVGVGRG